MDPQATVEEALKKLPKKDGLFVVHRLHIKFHLALFEINTTASVLRKVVVKRFLQFMKNVHALELQIVVENGAFL